MRAKSVFVIFFASLLFFGSFASSQIVYAEPSFSLEFGSFGDDDGEFDQPSGLALDTGSDFLYVADTGNDRIQIIDVDGNCSGNIELADDICFVDEFGGRGSGDGDFNSPTGVALDGSNDMLYVVDTKNERIQIIDVDGSCSGNDELADDVCFIDEFGDDGNRDGEFEGPLALVLDTSNDLVFVADTDNNRIQVLEISESSSSSDDKPTRPTGLKAFPISVTSIFLTWNVADPDEDVTGYKIQFKEGTGKYETVVSDSKSRANSFVHDGLSKSITYSYRIYAINDQGTSSVSSTVTEKPEDSLAPVALTADDISPSKIKLSWFPPTSTFGQQINGYEIKREIRNDVYEDDIGTTGSGTTTFTVSGLQTDKTYTYVVKASFSGGTSSPDSNTASATPTDDSIEIETSSVSKPSSPSLSAKVISETQINLTWNRPSDGGSDITGYKIEVKENSGSYSVLDDNTKSTSTTFSHTNLTPDTKYTYKVSAINSLGTGSSSNESSGTPTKAPEPVLVIKSIGTLSIDEGKRLAFIVGITDSSIDNARFSLASNAPSGTSISSSSGSFTWTPSNTQSGTYTFDVIAKTSSSEDRESITITVNDITATEPPKEEPPEPTKEEPPKPKELGVAPFVDESKDPQSYVDRYNNEPAYKKWFDDNYPEYSSISQAVGLKEMKGIAPFVDPNQDPQYYVDRYDNEPKYKEWFDENFPEYDSISEAVGLDEPTVVPPKIGECGEGTKLVDGICTVVDQPNGGGCLIATAAYGSEMAPQVQFLREIRDNKVMSTELGVSFMTGFNQFYYSFSPVIADYERENPLFKEAVKIGLTPMLSSLSILSVVDVDSEQGLLGYGIAIIMLNIGMYFVAPAMVLYGIKKAKLVRF